MSGQAFEFTPFGIKPLVEDPTGAAGIGISEFAPAAVKAAEPGFATEPSIPSPVAASVPGKAAELGFATAPSIPSPVPGNRIEVAAPATSPRAVVKAARARVKEIRAELRRMRRLEKELAELERLLCAAKEKPKASVRALRSAG